jgi:hypothetical protein
VVVLLVGGLAVSGAGSAGGQAGPPGEDRPEVGEELVERRTESTRTYATEDDDVFETRVYAGPVHYRDDEMWRAIETDLEPAGGELVAEQGPVTVAVPEALDDGELLSITDRQGRSVAVGLGEGVDVDAVEVDTAAGELVRFEDAVGDIDIELQSLPYGIKEDLILESPDDATLLEFPLEVDGLTAAEDDFGGISFSDGETAVFRMPPGFMEDSALPELDTGAVSTGVELSLVEAADGALSVAMSLDEAWLNHPARVFPVRVDPSVFNENPDADDTYVIALTTMDRSLLTQLKVGLALLGHRSFLRFSALDTELPANANVQASQLRLWQTTGATTCVPARTDAFRITASWTGSTTQTWGGPAVGALVASETNAAGAPGCGANWMDMDVTDAVQNWVDGTWDNHGFALRAFNESDSAQHKAFASAQAAGGFQPQLVVVWSEASAGDPLVPTDLAPTGALTELPTEVSATYEDQDSDSDTEGEDGYVAFGIRPQGTNSYTIAGTGETVASGETSTWTVSPGTFNYDTTYEMYTVAIDSTVDTNSSRRSSVVTFTTPPFQSRCDTADVDAELNDTRQHATPLSPSPMNGYVCDDPDVYSILVNNGADLTVDLDFDHDDGDLDLALYQSNGTLVAASDTATDDEQIVATDLTYDRYYIEVYGYDGASGTYTISRTVVA